MWLLHQQGQLDLGYALGVELLCEWPDALSKVAILPMLAFNRAQAGDLESAVWFGEHAVQAAQARAPSGVSRAKNPQWLLLLAWGYARLGDRDKARERLEEAESIIEDSIIPRRPGNPAAALLLQLVTAYARLGDVARSRAALARWERGTTGSQESAAGLLGGVAEVYAEAGHHDDAAKVAMRALATSGHPGSDALGHGQAHLALARVHLARNDGAGALQSLEQYDAAMTLHRTSTRASMAR
jgi:tetratricopeptide (TPR) repeat protein